MHGTGIDIKMIGHILRWRREGLRFPRWFQSHN